MTINPSQIQVSKIYPGNYTNVLRYWHSTSSFSFLNANNTNTTYSNQPVGGPVGVVFRPGWIAQQAIGYVDLSYQPGGTTNQLEYYTNPYGSGQNSANQPFLNADVIIPSRISTKMFGLTSLTVLMCLLAHIFIVFPFVLTAVTW